MNLSPEKKKTELLRHLTDAKATLETIAYWFEQIYTQLDPPIIHAAQARGAAHTIETWIDGIKKGD